MTAGTYSTTNAALIETMRLEIHALEGANAKLAAALHRRSHDPAWEIANAHAVHDEIACLPPTAPVCAAVGDVKDLKVWNSAMGAQAPFDAILLRGFASVHLRADDILGRGDGGDKIFVVCPTGEGRAPTDVAAVCERINETLRTTELRACERRAYVRGACAKAWGPWVGRVFEALHYLGVRTIVDYPRIDWEPVADGNAGGVLARIGTADRALFVMKAKGATI